MIAEELLRISGENEVLFSLLVGAFLAFATFFGSLFALFYKKAPKYVIELSLSFAAGIMLFAGFVSLILPSLELIDDFLSTSLGIFLGILMILAIDLLFPHEHVVKGYEGPEHFRRIKVVWLIIIAVLIHNIPEGLAVGTLLVFDAEKGIMTAIGIAIQDVPEGVIVALPIAVLGKSVSKAITLGLLSGISEMLMVVLGAFLFSYFSYMLPYGLAFAGGAMLYIVVKEMIPEIYRKEENALIVTFGFFSGFYLMLFLESI